MFPRVHCVSKNAAAFASCSFDKHELMWRILGNTNCWLMEQAVMCMHESESTSFWTSAVLKAALFTATTLHNRLHSEPPTVCWGKCYVLPHLRHSYLKANSHLVCDPTIRQPGFDLPRQQWSLLNRFCTEQRHCGACRRKWRLTDTDLCPCGETQTMSHIVESCPLTKLNGSLSRLHSADEDLVSWLTSYGLWHAYKKKKSTSTK